MAAATHDAEGDKEDAQRLASLLSARRALRSGLEKSRALSRALAPRLEGIQARLPAMEASVRPIRAAREALATAGPNIDRAVGPAAAVLKVFDAVHGLEPPLLDRAAVADDLPGYLAVLAQLEAALRLLSDNCGLATQWLADIVAYLGEKRLADARFVAGLAAALDRLRDAAASADLDAGLLAAALDLLEAEFRRLLKDHSAPLAMKDPAGDASDPPAVVPSRIPASIVYKLSLILHRLAYRTLQNLDGKTRIDLASCSIVCSSHRLLREIPCATPLWAPAANSQLRLLLLRAGVEKEEICGFCVQL